VASMAVGVLPIKVLAADVEPELEQQAETAQAAVSFAQAGEQIGTVSFWFGQAETELTAQMPQYLTVILVDGTQVQAPVTWTCLGDYAQTDDFYYEFVPQLDSTYVLAEGIDPLTQVPYIMAERGDAAQQTDDMTISSEQAASSNMNTIYSFLTQKCGFHTAAACGILANIECESSFNPNLYGDNGTSYGICQWHNERLTAMQGWCSENGYDWKTLNGQLNYLKKELSANNAAYLYNGLTISNKLKACANSASGAYDAAYNWCYYYEIPANKETVAVTRGNKAKTTYWSKFGGREAASSQQVYNVFSDISKGAWYCDAVQYVYENDIMVGVSSNKFQPNGTLDRAMAAAVTYNLSKSNAKFKLKSTNSSKFKDVSSSKWYADAVNWAAGAGVINGYSSTKFGPTDDLTREQFAVILYNYAKKLGCNVSASKSLSSFSDGTSVSKYAQTAMKWAAAKQIVTGSKLRPKAVLTRAEAAEMIRGFAATVTG
ncbi:MAG: phage tail tip lysozyme, partial [Eubacteriales bacterium]|nr:phage tail tip lysozyme [Eubacteriales bacterium]